MALWAGLGLQHTGWWQPQAPGAEALWSVYVLTLGWAHRAHTHLGRRISAPAEPGETSLCLEAGGPLLLQWPVSWPLGTLLSPSWEAGATLGVLRGTWAWGAPLLGVHGKWKVLLCS